MLKRASERRRSSPISELPGVLVADANVLLSAIIGGRASAVLVHPRAPRVVAPSAVGDEILGHLPEIAHKRSLDLGVLLPALAALPVEWLEADAYAALETEARQRMRDRDEDDWPVVASALAIAETEAAVAVWSQDKDLNVSGLMTLTTGQLLDRLEGRSEA